MNFLGDNCHLDEMHEIIKINIIKVIVTPPSRNDGVNQDHVEGFSAK
jgi:hypothetical protein